MKLNKYIENAKSLSENYGTKDGARVILEKE